MSNDTLPPPPAYYKEFASGPDAKQPPSLNAVKNNSSYTFFAEELQFDFEEPMLGSFGVEELYDPGKLFDMTKEEYAELLKKLIKSLNKSSEQLIRFLRENPSDSM